MKIDVIKRPNYYKYKTHKVILSLANKRESSPQEKEKEQDEQEPEQEAPLLLSMTFTVWDTPVSQLKSASLANLKLLMVCRSWQTYNSVPAKPGH